MNRHGTRTLAVGLALAAMWPGALDARAYAPAASVEAAVATLQEDAEERAYLDARRAITREQFQRAIELFSQMRTDFPQGRYAPEAYYWQAFSLYRMDGYREALSLLEAQLASYPEAKINADARELELRLRGLLARRGDAQSAAIALREVEAALAQSGIATRQAMTGSQAEVERALAMSAAATNSGRRELARELAARDRRSDRQQQACPDNDVQEAALNALMQIDTDRALPILRRVLERRDECSAPLRKQAIFVLSQHDVADAEDLMIDVARNDPDGEVKEAAVFWLSQVGTERALDALVDILESSDDAELHENAIYAVSQHRSPRAGELLRTIALDRTKSNRVREQAIFWLSQHPENANADFLIELYGRLESEALKENVFFSLSQLNDPRAVEWMLERALDDSESIELRKQALFWAGQQRSVDLDRLDGLYGRLRDREMKEQLIFLYSQRSEPAAIDALIRIAREEEDQELRKNAIFWLGQSNDERAIEFLLEIIGEPEGAR